MNKLLKFLGIDGSNKLSFMAWIGSVFIITYLITNIYQLVQLNIFFAQGKVKEEAFERLVSGNIKDLLEIVMIIVLFFFKNQNTKED
jgi:cadmium resistance protein CadD (predicted permease)